MNKLKVEGKNKAVLELAGEWRNEVLFSYGEVVAVVDRLSGYALQETETLTTAKHVNKFLATWGDRFGKKNRQKERVGVRHLPRGFFESTMLLGESAEERSVRADCWLSLGRDPSPDDCDSKGRIVARYGG